MYCFDIILPTTCKKCAKRFCLLSKIVYLCNQEIIKAKQNSMKGNSRWSLLVVGLVTLFLSCSERQVSESDIIKRVNEIYGKVAEVYASKPDAGLLDSLYCSNDWRSLVSMVADTDAGDGETGFFDADYWIMGQEWSDFSTDSVVVEQLEEKEARASLNLHNCGQTTRVGLLMVLENEEWKIDNFVDLTNNYDWKAHMNDYTETAASLLKTDSVGLVKEDADVEVRYYADYPTEGASSVVIDSIRYYIAEGLQGDISLVSQPDQLMMSAYEKVYEEMKMVRDEMSEEELADVPPFYVVSEIRKGADARKYVTYLSTYSEYQGGAHGISYETGVTFDKATGRRLGWDLLKDTDKRGFHLLLKEGLRQYFQSMDIEVGTDEQLKDMLYTDDDIDNLPLPSCPPYLTEKGLVFNYQQYEIAAYAAGILTFTIGYDRLRPYLTATGEALMKKE